MYDFLEDYVDQFNWMHADIENQITGLPPEALDWIPGEDIPSICVLVMHVVGAERYWIGDVVLNDSSNRDREAEFLSKNCRIDDLITGMEQNRRYISNSLKDINYEEFSSERISPRDGKKITVGWALNHAVEHTAIHLGHIQIIRQLWEQRNITVEGGSQ